MPDSPLTRIAAMLPGFLLAIVLHEVAHGYVAYRLGDDTAKRAGRLTLSPIAHLDPFGTIFFIVSSLAGLGFGWAKPVPVVIERLRNPRRDEILVTLAGPAANLLQAFAWAFVLRLVLHLGHVALVIICVWGVAINVLLMIFNLLPIPPLDGSHVAFRLLGYDNPHLADRLAPLGFVALILLIYTGLFDILTRVLVSPIVGRLLPPGLYF
ncbi:MAG: site-2 protease family protein [Armatimonadota bacterium]|nr:MAG: site-2 protease family protein [Armatimonadota bacterium]